MWNSEKDREEEQEKKKKKVGMWSNYYRPSVHFFSPSSLGFILSTWLGRDYWWRWEWRIQYWMQLTADPIALAEQWTKNLGKDKDHCKKASLEIRTSRK
jgi:hypothetical protein